MGNVSSADNDRVNELLTRRAKKKMADRNNKLNKQLQQQQQEIQQQPHPHQPLVDPYTLATSNSSSFPSSSNGIHSTPGHPMLRQKSANKCHPLDQAEFYGPVSSEWSNISTSSHSLNNGTSISQNNNRHTDYPPQSPASPSFSIPSSATTPTSASYNIDGPYLSSRFEDRLLDPVSAPPTSPQQRRQPPPVGSQLFPDSPSSTTPPHQYHTSPIVIPQHRQSQLSISSLDDGSLSSNNNRTSPASPAYQPLRRGSEHHILHQQQQHQLSADLRLLGTSPEAKDWLRQKPTRSSTHMIHQYNFHPHQYYQQPGSIAVKVVNNTCRNMGGDYPNVPSLPSLNARPSGPGGSNSNGRSKSYSSKGSVSTSVPSIPNGSTTATPGTNDTSPYKGGHRMVYTSEPIPTPSARARGMSQPEMTGGRNNNMGPHDDNNCAGTSEEVHAQMAQGQRANKLVMSRSKLVSPLAASLPTLPPTSASSSTTTASDGASNEDMQFASGDEGSFVPSNSRSCRPSSTLSSLRSLLGNHPQGLSLIESLEEDDDNDMDSLSDTETGDSEGDLIQRTESLLISECAESNGGGSGSGKEGKRSSRRRPLPQFEWMAARRRFSSSSISTISRDIQDSQKGQHALWKYIGGGNSHAPLRFDIDRILDSGCGLGEWTMEMAKEFPNATVYGIDINPELFPSVHQAVPSNCLFSPSNLLTRLSFPNQYFDFVYQRFLYLGLTVEDWPVALKELRRVMKPGGWIELFEPCMRVHRAGARTREVMRWCSRLLQEERGLDFDFAGEKMKRLCESSEIGFQNVKLERLSIPVGSWGGRVGQAMAENMVLIFQTLQSALIPAELTPSLDGNSIKAFDLMIQSWIRECEENKSYIDYYILVGQKPFEKEA
ncbi:MAG: hypothetical protein J3R72DRAFT_434902 [Linnemannia gamsii]|nr:MAG: hypothetical protein J3R72DRAFT_434902 [Linnemannia gamsii]